MTFILILQFYLYQIRTFVTGPLYPAEYDIFHTRMAFGAFTNGTLPDVLLLTELG